MVIIYTVGGAAGFALSSFAGAYMPRCPFWPVDIHRWRVGLDCRTASARCSPTVIAVAARMARSYATQYIFMLVIIGVFMPGIDNYAHMGGFAGGYLAARLLDPLKPERSRSHRDRLAVPGRVARLGDRVSGPRSAV